MHTYGKIRCFWECFCNVNLFNKITVVFTLEIQNSSSLLWNFALETFPYGENISNKLLFV